MIVGGGQRTHKTHKKGGRGRSLQQQAKDTLKKAIANGTLRELLWGEITANPTQDEKKAPSTVLEEESVNPENNEEEEALIETVTWNKLLTRNTLISGFEVADDVHITQDTTKKTNEHVAHEPTTPKSQATKVDSIRATKVQSAAKRASILDAIAKKTAKEKEKENGGKSKVTGTETSTGEERKEDDDHIDRSRRGTYAGVLSKPRRYAEIMRDLKAAALALAAKEQIVEEEAAVADEGKDENRESDTDGKETGDEADKFEV